MRSGRRSAVRFEHGAARCLGRMGGEDELDRGAAHRPPGISAYLVAHSSVELRERIGERLARDPPLRLVLAEPTDPVMLLGDVDELEEQSANARRTAPWRSGPSAMTASPRARRDPGARVAGKSADPLLLVEELLALLLDGARGRAGRRTTTGTEAVIGRRPYERQWVRSELAEPTGTPGSSRRMRQGLGPKQVVGVLCSATKDGGPSAPRSDHELGRTTPMGHEVKIRSRHRLQRPHRLGGGHLLRRARLASYGVDNNMRRDFFGPDGDTTWNLERLRRSTSRFAHHDARHPRSRRDRRHRRSSRSPTSIIHCAAQPSHDLAADRPFDDFDVNAGGTLNLLEAARQHCPETPFVFIRTNKVYGDAPNELPLVELETRWDYATRRHARHRRDLPDRRVAAQPVRRLEGWRPTSWSRSTAATSACRPSASAAAASPGRSHSGAGAARLPRLPGAARSRRGARTASSATRASRSATTSTRSTSAGLFEAFHRAPGRPRSTTSAAGAQNSVSVLEAIARLEELTRHAHGDRVRRRAAARRSHLLHQRSQPPPGRLSRLGHHHLGRRDRQISSAVCPSPAVSAAAVGLIGLTMAMPPRISSTSSGKDTANRNSADHRCHSFRIKDHVRESRETTLVDRLAAVSKVRSPCVSVAEIGGRMRTDRAEENVPEHSSCRRPASPPEYGIAEHVDRVQSEHAATKTSIIETMRPSSSGSRPCSTMRGLQQPEVLERIDGQERAPSAPSVDDHGAVEAREDVFHALADARGIDIVTEDRA